MSKRVIFKYKAHTKPIALGQSADIAIASYFKSKELGCDEIVLQWPNIRFLWDDYGNSYGGFNYIRDSILPLQFAEYAYTLYGDYNIDLGKENSLYDGCPPIVTDKGCSTGYCHRYIKDYYKGNGLPRITYDEYKNNYILIHYRQSEQTRQRDRNIQDKWYIDVIDYIRNNSDLPIYKIGEVSSFDNKVDRVYPYFYRNIGKLFKLVKDCKVYIGSPSGPWTYAIYFGKPLFVSVKEDYIYDREKEILRGVSDSKQILVKSEDYEQIHNISKLL